jgi:enoyl-CoA hydratase/carnithine racemase
VDWTHFKLDANRLNRNETAWNAPLAFVDLSQQIDPPAELHLPPCPVIGLGDAAGPLAQELDAVLEDPVGGNAILEQVTAHPRAAATVVQLLRVLPDLALDSGLVAESFAYAMLQGSSEHRAWLAARDAIEAKAGEGKVAVDRDGPRLTITLDRPEAGNAIDRAMRDLLYEALELAAVDPEIGTVRLHGNGRAFSLGAELSEFGTTTDPATAHAIRMRTLPALQAIRCAGKIEAHIQGACVGAGLELAAFARHIVATPNAWFQLPELAMGILPGAGGCVSLTRRIGRQRTAQMILSSKRINARQALEWGLIDELVDELP